MTGRLLIFNSDQIRTDQNRSDQTHPPLGWVGLGPDPLGSQAEGPGMGFSAKFLGSALRQLVF